ncbi:MAG: hypothetical protein B6U76_04135 [Desulfurococcales archaeon ex4484_217_2]|nr:MAG: hypothetical protein B6U76_04135 [Desulfurococcales archaeon ex4484_217_2]
MYLWFDLVVSSFLLSFIVFIMFLSVILQQWPAFIVLLGFLIAYVWCWYSRDLFILRNRGKCRVVVTEGYDPLYFEAKGFKLSVRKIPFSWFKYYEVTVNNVSFIVYPTRIIGSTIVIPVNIHFIPKNANEEDLRKILQLIPA